MAALDFSQLQNFLQSRLENQRRMQDPVYQMNMKIQEATLRQMLEEESRQRQARDYIGSYDTSKIDQRFHPSLKLASVLGNTDQFLAVLSQVQERKRQLAEEDYLRGIVDKGITVEEARGGPPGSFASLYRMTPDYLATSPEWGLAKMQEEGATNRSGIAAGAQKYTADVEYKSAVEGRLSMMLDKGLVKIKDPKQPFSKENLEFTDERLSRTGGILLTTAANAVFEGLLPADTINPSNIEYDSKGNPIFKNLQPYTDPAVLDNWIKLLSQDIDFSGLGDQGEDNLRSYIQKEIKRLQGYNPAPPPESAPRQRVDFWTGPIPGGSVTDTLKVVPPRKWW